jgi:hypothetical protein
MTDAQQVAYDLLLTRWSTVGEPKPLLGGGGCIMVEVTSDNTGITMLLGIETDGHTHS